MQPQPVLSEAGQASSSGSGATCQSCGQRNQTSGGINDKTGWNSFVYAVGLLSTQFPDLGVEKEFVQLAGGVSGRDIFERALLHRVLSDPDNLYLARHLCWVFTTQHQDAFTILPRDDAEVSRLVELMEPEQSDDIMHVLIGRITPAVPPGSPCMASGLPAVVADQLHAFTMSQFAQALAAAPRPDEPEVDSEVSGDARADDEAEAEMASSPHKPTYDQQAFRTAVREVLMRLTRRTNNRGLSDEHRALNYLALRYPAVYHAVLDAYQRGKILVDVSARHGHSSNQRLVAVTLTFRHSRTDIVERYRCLVNVTWEFPFLESRLELSYE